MPFYTYVRVGSHIRTCRPTHTAAQAHTYVRVKQRLSTVILAA